RAMRDLPGRCLRPTPVADITQASGHLSEAGRLGLSHSHPLTRVRIRPRSVRGAERVLLPHLELAVVARPPDEPAGRRGCEKRGPRRMKMAGHASSIPMYRRATPGFEGRRGGGTIRVRGR